MKNTITLRMCVEVMGCPTVCQHCWAMGRGYQAMPLEDITWVLHEVRRYCDAHAFAFGGFPMHEVAAHLIVAKNGSSVSPLWDLYIALLVLSKKGLIWHNHVYY